MTIDFAEAVRRSNKLLESSLRDELAEHFGDDFMLLVMGSRLLRNDLAWLLAWAEGSPNGFDATKLAIAYALERGEELPPEAQAWLVQYLRGQVHRPNDRRGRKDEYWLHSVIWIAVGNLVSEGMKATRNDTSEPRSGCDAVAHALAGLGLKPTTFHGVKRIWLEWEKRKGSTIEAT